MTVPVLPPRALHDDDVVRSQHFLALAPLPANVGRGREFVRACTPDLAQDDVDTVLLLTSELVTNAVIHARTELRLGTTTTLTAVVVTVYDLDLGRREVPTMSPRDGGRGLLLVEALASAWEIHHHHLGGKTVWFRLNCTPMNPRPDSEPDRGPHPGADQKSHEDSP